MATHSTDCLAATATATRLAIACLICLLFAADTSAQQAANSWIAPRKIDRSQTARQGLRVLEGRHITIITDLESAPAVDELPKVVDAAVPLLAQRFGVPSSRTDDWRVLAMLLKDREKFAAAGLMPTGNEEFPNGLSIGYELWVADQSSDYYRRHLLIHEVVHSFMATQLGNCGPSWYMEGMAELIGTHHWQSDTGELQLAIMPQDRQQVYMWGRTKLIRTAVDDQRMLPIAAVMKIDNTKALGVESYAWVWSLAKLLDTHPRYQQRFRQLQAHTNDPKFDARFRRMFAKDWSHLETEWRLMAATLEYGHDIAAEAIDFASLASPPVALDKPTRVKVLASRGWQSTGLVVEQGVDYELKASGRYVIGREPDGTPWACEPGGITLEYHRGVPLGKLLAVVDPRPLGERKEGTSAFLTPQPIGLRGKLDPGQSGVLYLRLNDSPARLNDNLGNAMVSIRRIPQ